MESVINRGDVFLVQLSGKGSEQSGLRPMIIVSNEVCCKYSPVLTAVPLTSKMMKKSLPTHVILAASQYPVEKDSIVLCEQIITIDKSRIVGSEPLFRLNELEMIRLNRAMSIQLGLVEPRQTRNNNINRIS